VSRAACFLFLVVGALLVGGPARAAAPPDSSVVSLGRFDYAVPDMPAFQLLDVDPQSILRPGTRREIAAIVEDVNPREFALECAPFLLARDREIPLQDYQRKRWLYNLRVSLGTRTSASGPTRAALGLRFSLLDGADPYTNRALLAAATSAAEKIRDIRGQGADQVIGDLGAVAFAALPLVERDSLVAGLAFEERRQLIRSLGVVPFAELEDAKRESLITARLGPGPTRAAEREFERARELFKSGSEWNRNVLELGLALAGAAPDSVGHGVHGTGYAAWLTGGLRLGPRGQLLAGGSGRIAANEETGALDRRAGGAALRAYYGANTAKAAASLDVGWREHALATSTAAVGLEFRLIESLWVNSSLGMTRDGSGRSRFTTSLSLRYALAGLIPSARAMGL
jgi:hypothetical protein